MSCITNRQDKTIIMNFYCPDDITELKKERKKLGQFSVWLVCPDCGYRTREAIITARDLNFSDKRKEANKVGGKKPEPEY